MCTRHPGIANRHQRAIGFRSAIDQNRGTCRPTSKNGDTDVAQHLLELLQYDSKMSVSDTATCLRFSQFLDNKAKSRAAAMIRNASFKAYMEEAHSSSLLVNGRADLSATDGSPLSLVVAELARISEEPDTVFVVKYFCSEHRPAFGSSISCSPAGLMASLVGQLVSQMIERGIAVNLAFLTQVEWKNVEKLKLKTLCTIFHELVLQLPAQSVLLCLVDEVSLYETSTLGGDVDAVIRRLTRLVRLTCKHDEVVFKVLVTCQCRGLGISKHFLGQTVDLDEDIEVDDLATWQISTMRI
jgi:hypothetical protein